MRLSVSRFMPTRSRCGTRATVCGALLTGSLLFASGVLEGQSVVASGAQPATRSELVARVAELERTTASGNLSGVARTREIAELAAIRNRLQDGDFRVGDRFILTLRQEAVLSDTVSVRDSLNVTIAGLPDVSLKGMLRSELDERMSSHVARFLRNATVRTRVLTRVAIQGAVRNPGFYYVDPDRPLSDLVMVAGGPVELANLNEAEINRGTAKVLSAKDSKRAIKEGRTLEQIDVQSGDEVRIPAKRGRPSFQAVIQLLFVFSSLFFAFLQFLQWYYSRLDQ
jgi:protein involved in polysaccharide export with SLBB domain